jgi:hypothetical protein
MQKWLCSFFPRNGEHSPFHHQDGSSRDATDGAPIRGITESRVPDYLFSARKKERGLVDWPLSLHMILRKLVYTGSRWGILT